LVAIQFGPLLVACGPSATYSPAFGADRPEKQTTDC
jgi:hypothetical protein